MDAHPDAEAPAATNPTPGGGGVLYSHAQTPAYRDGSELFVLTPETALFVSPEADQGAAAAKEAIDAGADPDEAMAAVGVDLDDVKRIPTAAITKIVIFGDESDLRIHWTKPGGGEAEERAWLTNDTARAAAYAAVGGVIQPATESEEEASLLHVGILPLTGVGAGVLVAVVAYTASALAGSGSGRRNVLVRVLNLVNILPLWLWLALALLIIAASLFWWFTASKDRPMKTTLSRNA